ncbi:shikimate dehydrogenase [Thalassotalea atypica]|uniref:shikimate dehydrogenase n=1 Tax=Thalassotalea atypica TaxID=2054316 RepID=UPI0025739BD8|nr:shikimate dehydrogenase [Thalassotalea atypica]
MDQYRVFGNPIAQSKSPFIHQQFALSTKQVLNYRAQLAQDDTFLAEVESLIKNNGKGANVTAPFKELAYQLCDHLSERAQMAGAVNTLLFNTDGIYGDTTDGLGLVSDLKRHAVGISEKRVLLLGAGGAAKGVVQALLDEKPSKLVIANRTLSKAETIVSQYNIDNFSACTFEQANEQIFDIIINATSAGLSQQALPIAEHIISKAGACYDMVYGKTPTPFLQTAKQLNVNHVIDGLGMLVGQAAESFMLWRNVMPDVEPVLKLLRAEINGNQS